jgi:hypothetical protein
MDHQQRVVHCLTLNFLPSDNQQQRLCPTGDERRTRASSPGWRKRASSGRDGRSKLQRPRARCSMGELRERASAASSGKGRAKRASEQAQAAAAGKLVQGMASASSGRTPVRGPWQWRSRRARAVTAAGEIRRRRPRELRQGTGAASSGRRQGRGTARSAAAPSSSVCDGHAMGQRPAVRQSSLTIEEEFPFHLFTALQSGQRSEYNCNSSGVQVVFFFLSKWSSVQEAKL